MKFTKTILASAVLLATSSFAIAATDTTNIEINVTKDAYVNLTGTLAGGTAVPLTQAEVNGGQTILGTLGTESNTSGSCSVSITSANAYELLHTATSAPLHSGAKYSIDWGTDNYSTTNSTGSFSSCTNLASNFTMNSPSITTPVVIAGTYSDTLTVIVTTQ